MGEYSAEDIRRELESTGELIVVLGSGIEYDLHLHDTRFPTGDNASQLGDLTGTDIVETEGLFNGEYRIVRFPANEVEHTYIHKES